MSVTERKKRKLFNIAKELNLASQTIKEFLEKKGQTVKNPNMVIPEDIYEEILRRFSHEKKEADKVHKEYLEAKEKADLVAEDPDYGEIICRCEQITKKEVMDAILQANPSKQ